MPNHDQPTPQTSTSTVAKTGHPVVGQAAASMAPAVPVAAPTQAAGSGWLAIAAFALSVFTLLKTLYGDWRARRGKAAAKFEADYGTPIRTGLRSYEKALSTLRTYTISNAKPLRALKKEIEAERGKWTEAGDEMVRLLHEVDASEGLASPGWGVRFQAHAERAEEDMLAMTEPGIADVEQLKAAAEQTHQRLVAAIAEVRTSLRSEIASYDNIGRRKRRR